MPTKKNVKRGKVLTKGEAVPEGVLEEAKTIDVMNIEENGSGDKSSPRKRLSDFDLPVQQPLVKKGRGGKKAAAKKPVADSKKKGKGKNVEENDDESVSGEEDANELVKTVEAAAEGTSNKSKKDRPVKAEAVNNEEDNPKPKTGKDAEVENGSEDFTEEVDVKPKGRGAKRATKSKPPPAPTTRSTRTKKIGVKYTDDASDVDDDEEEEVKKPRKAAAKKKQAARPKKNTPPKYGAKVKKDEEEEDTNPADAEEQEANDEE